MTHIFKQLRWSLILALCSLAHTCMTNDVAIAQTGSRDGYFGISVNEATSLLAQRLGIQQQRGVLVIYVWPGEASDLAGLRAGDLITRFSGTDTPSVSTLQSLIGRTTAGMSYRFEFYRGHKYLYLDIVAGAMPPKQDLPLTFDLGMLLVPAGTPSAVELGIESPTGTAISSVRPGGAADRAGLRRGDLIVAWAGQPTDTFEDYQTLAFASPLGSQQTVTCVRGQTRFNTTITMNSAPYQDPPRHYAHPSDSFRMPLPPYWYAFDLEQPELSTERQHTRIISPFGAFEMACFKSAWEAESRESALAAFVQRHRGAAADRFQGTCNVGGHEGVWVSQSEQSGQLIYRISFVHGRQRFVINVLAPVLSDPQTLPRPISDILSKVQFRPLAVAATGPIVDTGTSAMVGSATVGSIPLPPEPLMPAPGPSRFEDEPIPADWQTVRLEGITLRLPQDWKASEFNAADEGTWFIGSELFPDASFSLHRDTTIEDVRGESQLRDRSQIRIVGSPALQYVVERSAGRAEKGIIVAIFDEQFPGGLIMSAFAPVERFEQTEPVFRKIISSLSTGVQGTPADVGPGGQVKRPGL